MCLVTFELVFVTDVCDIKVNSDQAVIIYALKVR